MRPTPTRRDPGSVCHQTRFASACIRLANTMKRTVHTEIARLTDEGLFTQEELNTTCCFAAQDKVRVTSPSGERWEIYTVLADSDTFGPNADQTCCTARLLREERPTRPVCSRNMVNLDDRAAARAARRAAAGRRRTMQARQWVSRALLSSLAHQEGLASCRRCTFTTPRTEPRKDYEQHGRAPKEN